MTLCSLPLELVSLVVESTSKAERFSLCLTNKRLAQIAQPSLFRYFSLRDPTKAVKCFLLVIAKPQLGLAVRNLLVSFQDSVVLPVSFWKLVSRGLSCMSNITSLHFAGIFLSDIIFRDVTFPRLRKFSSIIYVTPEVSRFLDRHPTITQLFVGGETTAATLDVHPNFLPSLTCFMGSLCVAEKVVPGRPVMDITLAWITPVSEERTTDIIKSFSLSTIPIQQFFCTTLHIKENRISLLVAVARYLPHLRLLRLNNFSLAGVLDQLFIDTLTSLLPRFKHLQRLIVPSVLLNTHPSAHDRSLRLQEDKLTVEWKKSCPQLTHIVFPSCHIYDYDVSSQVWNRKETTLSQSISIFYGVH